MGGRVSFSRSGRWASPFYARAACFVTRFTAAGAPMPFGFLSTSTSFAVWGWMMNPGFFCDFLRSVCELHHVGGGKGRISLTHKGVNKLEIGRPSRCTFSCTSCRPGSAPQDMLLEAQHQNEASRIWRESLWASQMLAVGGAGALDHISPGVFRLDVGLATWFSAALGPPAFAIAVASLPLC